MSEEQKGRVPLSARMRAVKDLVPPCACLADVGTDHGYLPAALVMEKKAERAIAMDVNRGPLERAKEHIRMYGLEDRIDLRLSDGLSGLRPREADVILIAGMGGPLTIRILEAGEAVLEAGIRALVLQPQSEVPSVRKYLTDEGYRIVREDFVTEGGKYYPMMKAEKTGQKEKLTDLQLTYGPRLLETRPKPFLEYLGHEEKTLLGILDRLKEAGECRKNERAGEISERLKLLREAMGR